MIELRFVLSWPPSVNSYWSVMRRGPLAGRLLLSSEARWYRKRCSKELTAQRVPFDRLTGSLEVSILAHPPDRRARDLDNITKPILDAIKQARVIEDDRYVDRLVVERGSVRETPGVIVTLRQLTAAARQEAMAL